MRSGSLRSLRHVCCFNVSCCSDAAGRRGRGGVGAEHDTFVRVDSALLHLLQLNAFSVMRVMRIRFTVLFLYDGKSGCPALIHSRSSSVRHLTPVVVIKHPFWAYNTPAAGAFHDITQPHVSLDLPSWSRVQKRAKGEPVRAPGSCD